MILINSIRTPDGTVLESNHVHDYVSHKDKNGNTYAIDGGKEYLKRVYDVRDFEELSKDDVGDHLERRKYLKWGNNYDENMNRLPETNWLAIENMNTGHIQTILNGNYTNNPLYLETFKNELVYRKENNL